MFPQQQQMNEMFVQYCDNMDNDAALKDSLRKKHHSVVRIDDFVHGPLDRMLVEWRAMSWQVMQKVMVGKHIDRSACCWYFVRTCDELEWNCQRHDERFQHPWDGFCDRVSHGLLPMCGCHEVRVHVMWWLGDDRLDLFDVDVGCTCMLAQHPSACCCSMLFGGMTS